MDIATWNALMSRRDGDELAEAHDRRHLDMDLLELELLATHPVIEMPVTHRFVPGMYIRTIFMPKGTKYTSKIHKTQHPFVILQGSAMVYSPDGGVEHLRAPHFGITQPGTRRALHILADCVWTTFHPALEDETCEADLPKIEARIIERRDLPGGGNTHEIYRQMLADAKQQQIHEGDGV